MTGDTVHVLFTSNGSPYVNYQARHRQGAGIAGHQQQPGPARHRRRCGRPRQRASLSTFTPTPTPPPPPPAPPSHTLRLPPRPAAALAVPQTLALYGTYRLAQRMRPGGDKMVAFTRILHRTTDDALSPCVPTFRADPLHPGALRGLAPGREHGRGGDGGRAWGCLPPAACLLAAGQAPGQRVPASAACGGPSAECCAPPGWCPPAGRAHAVAGCDGGVPGRSGRCRYVVADRPGAVRQFFQAAQLDPTLIKVRGARPLAGLSPVGAAAGVSWAGRAFQPALEPLHAPRRHASQPGRQPAPCPPLPYRCTATATVPPPWYRRAPGRTS